MSIWVGRYAIVDGAVREHGPAFVDRVRSREDETVRLLVLADPADARSAEFCPQVADAVAELFSREALSVTGGLLRALRLAHANLAEWNRRSLREHAVAVGITCVAIRDGEVTIAQVGPGSVYVRGPEGLQRFVAADSDGEAPIGGTDPIAPQFHQVRIDGRQILLLTGNVEQTIGQSAIATALAAGPERALVELFTRTRSISDMTAALVADIDVPEEALAAAEEQGVEDEDFADGTLRTRSEPVGTAPVRAVDSGADVGEAPRHRLTLPSLRRERSAYGQPAQPPGALARVGARRAAPARAGGSLAYWRPAALAAAALLTIALLGWCTLPGLLRQDRTSQLEDALASAQTHVTAAQRAPDVTQSRSELDAARSQVALARGITPGDPRVEAMQAQVDQFAKSLDAVVDLGDGLKRVAAFDGTVTAPFNMVTLAFGDNVLWLVEGQRGRVFRLDPSGRGEPQELYRTGATYGGTTARDPRALAWDATGQRLLLVDAGPTLFTIAPGKTPVPVPMRGAKDLKSIAAIAAYSGNLYVLDPSGGEIWRYLPGGEGFDSERAALLGGADLGDTRAMVVDGDFYVLGASSVRHFRAPRELEPLLKGIDRPIGSASGIAADQQRQLFYVGDRAGRRVVVSDREGAYRRQYRHPAFVDLRGVALSADGSTAYVLTGDGVYSFVPTP